MQVITVFFAALLALVASQCNSGVSVRGACSCFSGFTGNDCLVDETAGCTFPTSAPLVTSRVAELNVTLTRVASNNFVFVVNSAATFGRHFTEISLAGNDSCSYPNGPVVKTFSGCNDVYTGTFSIPQVTSCGFNKADSPTETTLSGAISVTAVEPITTFRGTPISRTTSSSLRVRLNLPRTYTLTTGNLTVVSPIQILSAVTRQEYNPEADNAVIEITTSVQWPYILSFNQTLQIPSVSLTASAPSTSGVGATCLAESGDCLQTTTLTLGNIASICNFDGTLSLQWTSDCRTLPTPCPIDGTDTHSISATIVSGNLCPVFEVVSSLTGDLFAFTNGEFGTQALSFVANQPVFLGVTLTASVEIMAIQVSSLTVIVGGVPKVLVSGRNPQSGFGAIDFQGDVGTYSSDPSRLGFSFVATYGESNAIFLSSGSSVQIFTVEAVFSITYVTSFKRDMLVETFTLSKELVLDASRF